MGTGGLFLRKVRATIEDEPTGFVWVESGTLAGSGYPASRAQVEWLVKQGIKAILTLTEQPLPGTHIDGFGLTVMNVPMRDHQVPGTDALLKGVKFIEEQVQVGRPVAVHCMAGEGRTGCVLAAYLIRTRGMSADEALTTLRKTKEAFVEWKQEEAVRRFAETESAR